LCLGRMRKAGRGLPGLMSMLGLSALLLGGILGCSSGNSPSTQETGSKTILITASTSSFTRTIPLVINIQ
ncbi:MAG TPA: hypothetical protein VHZ55_02140, partial [Bryobacteraceae bacterium]|nr:hypothetical protein [Bryobacteraceae bacterium]